MNRQRIKVRRFFHPTIDAPLPWVVRIGDGPSIFFAEFDVARLYVYHLLSSPRWKKRRQPTKEK